MPRSKTLTRAAEPAKLRRRCDSDPTLFEPEQSRSRGAAQNVTPSFAAIGGTLPKHRAKREPTALTPDRLVRLRNFPMSPRKFTKICSAAKIIYKQIQ